MALIKTSVCLLVVRIKPDKKLKIFVGVIIAVLATASFEVSVVLLAQCRPISAHWRGAKPGQCWYVKPMDEFLVRHTLTPYIYQAGRGANILYLRPSRQVP
jgi:hypothetical protein